MPGPKTGKSDSNARLPYPPVIAEGGSELSEAITVSKDKGPLVTVQGPSSGTGLPSRREHEHFPSGGDTQGEAPLDRNAKILLALFPLWR